MNQYNLARYNLPQARDFELYTEITANLTLVASADRQEIIQSDAQANFVLRTDLGELLLLHETSSTAELSIRTQLGEFQILVVTRPIAEVSLRTTVVLGKEIPTGYDADLQLMSNAHLGKVVYTFGTVAELELRTSAHLGKEVITDKEAIFTLNAHALMGLMRTIVFDVNVVIPPGAEIRIDSHFFTVFLGQQNIFHLHSGDWITLDRNTVELVVSAAQNMPLVGNILYNERFL